MSVTGKGENAVHYPSKPENIQNVYFAGQRLRSPGGLSAAVDSGQKQCNIYVRIQIQYFKVIFKLVI